MKTRTHIVVLISLLGALAVACGERPAAPAPDERVSAVSPDGRFSYLLDSGEEQLRISDAKSGAPLATVAVGRVPERLTVGADGAVYVVNRGARSVSVIDPGELKESRRIAVGVEPVALEVSADNKLLYVVNAASIESPDRGSLSVVDLEAGKLAWEVALEGTPRQLKIEGNLARVSVRGDRELKVDLARRVVLDEAPPEPEETAPEQRSEAPATRASLLAIGTVAR